MVAVPSEPSPNLHLWTGCWCSLNPDPSCFFSPSYYFGSPVAEYVQPFFPLAQTVGAAPGFRLHSASPQRWNQSHLILVRLQDHQWGGTLLCTPSVCASLCCPAASEPSAQPVRRRERPWTRTPVTPELWAWSNPPQFHTAPDSFQQSPNHCSRTSVISDYHRCWNLDFRFLVSAALIRACWCPWVKYLNMLPTVMQPFRFKLKKKNKANMKYMKWRGGLHFQRLTDAIEAISVNQHDNYWWWEVFWACLFLRSTQTRSFWLDSCYKIWNIRQRALVNSWVQVELQ